MSIKGSLKTSLVTGFSLPVINNIVHHIAASNSIVFMLHRFQYDELGIEGSDPDFLRQCLQLLRKKNFNLVTVDDIVEANYRGEPIKNAIAFTVDDGYIDHAEIAGKIFAEYDCPASYYLITNFVDGDYWPEDAKVQYLLEETKKESIDWAFDKLALKTSLTTPQQRHLAVKHLIWSAKVLPIEQLQLATNSLAKALEVDLPDTPPGQYRPMTWEHARSLEKQGARIGAHTLQHATLSRETKASATHQIMGSFEAVKRNVNNPSNIFCYPTGRNLDFNSENITTVKECGFIGAISANPGYHTSNQVEGMFSIPRFSIPDNLESLQQITLYIEYFKDKLRSLR